MASRDGGRTPVRFGRRVRALGVVTAWKLPATQAHGCPVSSARSGVCGARLSVRSAACSWRPRCRGSMRRTQEDTGDRMRTPHPPRWTTRRTQPDSHDRLGTPRPRATPRFPRLAVGAPVNVHCTHVGAPAEAPKSVGRTPTSVAALDGVGAAAIASPRMGRSVPAAPRTAAWLPNLQGVRQPSLATLPVAAPPPGVGEWAWRRGRVWGSGRGGGVWRGGVSRCGGSAAGT